ncbi:MAG: MATE family efflux transporter [Lachnospiraceae bacterium]|nr:MATE family efflux transporter [Lachnospiraceae bacterium]
MSSVRSRSSRYEIDMVHGPIMPKLFSFFIPLFLSGILQLLFNAIDIIVVGRFSGSDALAAVGATTSLINMLINLFMGISLGSNVLVARYRAAGDHKALEEVVHTAVTVALASGILMVIVGQLVSRLCLTAMDTPASIIDQSTLYMRIYFCGMPFLMLYNFCASILRGIGDTKRPMIFLIISGICNAVLNLILVIVFKMGVAGVAIATVFAQFISACLVLRILLTTEEAYRIRLKQLRINRRYLIKTLQIGIPAGIQTLIINFSNVLLQSSVNSFGPLAMAGYTAANSIFSFIFMYVDSISQACMNFTSQNYGAHQKKRLDITFRDCVILEIVFGLIIGSLVMFFGKPLLRIYTPDETAIGFGMQILSVTVMMYFICGLMNVVPAAMRGLGSAALPMILTLIGTVGTRIVWIFCFFPHRRTLDYLFWSYPLSWIIAFILQLCFYLRVRRKVYATIPD